MAKSLSKLSTLLALSALLLLVACAEVKEASRSVGHTTRNVTRDIGHGSRDTVNALGKGAKRVAKSISR
ncbi:MAG: hypothetical protein ABL925_10865 [Methylococcales bacterium]